MAVDSFSHSTSDVLNDLDPLSRALLDLSIQRGMDDAEIADVLGTDAESVFEVRVGLLRSLAERVAPEHADADVPELQAVVAERLYAGPEADDAPAAPAVAADDMGDEVDEAELYEPLTEVDEEPARREVPAWASDTRAPRDEPRKRRSPLVILLPLLVAIAVVGGILALAGGSDDDGGEPAAPPPPAAPDRPADEPAGGKPKPRATRLTPVGGSDARGTAAIDGDRLTLKLRDLPDPRGGAYEIWLYDSVIDAKSLGSSQDTRIDLDARLPDGARDYRYVDVSLEPADGNRNHSGQSILRVPVDELTR